jgi:UDP-N-acetylmuramoylalanine-D-glutamate ligase
MYLDKLIKLKLSGQKIGLLGFGIENKQFYDWVVNYVEFPKENIIIFDKNLTKIPESENNDYSQIDLRSGSNYLDVKNLIEVETLFKSPGIWSLKDELNDFRNIKGEDSILSPLVFFIEKYQTCTIGVTGTKGKTTTSSLTKFILESQLENKNYQIEYCGNTTNISPYKFWQKKEFGIKEDNKIFIIELSSFQLQDLGYSKISPKYSIITNYYIDHLDQHEDKNEYWEAKNNIFKYPSTPPLPSHHLFLNQNTKLLIEDTLSKTKNLEIHTISLNEILKFKSIINSPLLGEHNWQNLTLALLCSKQLISNLNLNFDLTKINLSKFKQPEGRLELVCSNHQSESSINFYNDNTATEPDAVVAGIKALWSQENLLWLILGGKSKKGEIEKVANLIKEIIESDKVKNKETLKVSYCGEVGKIVWGLINQEIQENEKNIFNLEHEFEKTFKNFDYYDSSKNRLSLVNLLSKKFQSNKSGKVLNILLSPGGSSFDEFNSYIERGELYKKWANNLN